MNYREQVQKCADEMTNAGLFFGHGTDNALDEAAWLVLCAIEAPVDGSFAQWDQQPSIAQEQRITALLTQRIKSRQPLAYLTGEAWFCGLKFIVDRNVIVPRSPIAELIRCQFSPWIQAERIGSVLDLCTGSGCIGIAIARFMPWLRVDATDISHAALLVAEKNRQAHAVQEQLQLLHSDLFQALAGRRYDLVVTNPPYVSKALFDSLPPEYHAEPAQALLTGSKGLEIPLEIMLRSPLHLHAGGVLICEVGENAGLLKESLPGLPMTWLEFEQGGEGVFTIERELLLQHQAEIMGLMEKLRNVA